MGTVRIAHCDWKSGERFSNLDNVETECGIIFQVFHEFMAFQMNNSMILST